MHRLHIIDLTVLVFYWLIFNAFILLHLAFFVIVTGALVVPALTGYILWCHDDFKRAKTRYLEALAADGSDNLAIETIEGNIAAVPADVIVNTWNCNYIPWPFVMLHGTSKAILRAAGHEPFAQTFMFGPLRPGSAIDTDPGRMACKRIIHVAGLNVYWFTSNRIVRRAVHESLTLAAILGYESVALPLIGAGTGGMHPLRSEAVIREAIEEVAHLPLRVTIVKFAGAS